MTAVIYEYIGRFIVQLAWFRFGRQIKLAGGVLAALTVVAGYLIARREPPEG